MKRHLAVLVVCTFLATPTLAADNVCKPGDTSPECAPSKGPDAPKPTHEKPEKPDRPGADKDKPGSPKEHPSDKPGSIHTEGHGWGSISTGRSVEPSGYYKDGTVGVGVTIHFMPLPEAKSTYLALPDLK